MIVEVWKLIDELEEYDPYDPVRVLTEPGVLSGIKLVRDMAGRVTIIPEKTLDNLRKP